MPCHLLANFTSLLLLACRAIDHGITEFRPPRQAKVGQIGVRFEEGQSMRG